MGALRDHETARIRTRELAARWRGLPWYETAVVAWPGPVAHEIEALGITLDSGEAGAAILQWTDTAETFLKFLTLSLAREVMAAGEAAEDAGNSARGDAIADEGQTEGPTRAAAEIRELLLQGRLSGGKWTDVLYTAAARAMELPDIDDRPTGRFGRFVAGPKAPFPAKMPDAFVALRNNHVGHTALAADPLERYVVLRNLLFGDDPGAVCRELDIAALQIDRRARPDNALAAWFDLASAHAVFDGAALDLVAGDVRRSLAGAESVRDLHRDTRPDRHRPVEARVVLSCAESALLLNPWIAAEVCARCRHQDVFFYDSLHDWHAPGRFDLLDYPQGHKMRRRGGDLRALGAELSRIGAADLGEVERILAGADGGSDLWNDSRAVVRSLDRAAFDTRYVTPGHLKAAVETFIAGRDRGVLWLQAPRDVGKTVFAQAIADRGLVRTHDPAASAFLEPLFVQARGMEPDRAVALAGLFIRHGYRFVPSEIAGVLTAELFRALRLRDEVRNDCPRLDVSGGVAPGQLGAVLADFIGWFANAAKRGDGIWPEDGLVVVVDGLDELPDPSFVDYIPRAEQLPVGVFLILLSRRTDAVSFPGQAPSGGVDDPYADERNLQEAPAWLKALEARLLPQEGAEIQRFDLADQNYVRLLNAYIDKELADRGDVLGALDGDRRQQLLQASLYRFKYLAFFVDRLDQGDLKPEEMSAMSAARDAVRAYLSGLRDTVGSPKLADLAVDILVALAAFERGHAWYYGAEVRQVAGGEEVWEARGFGRFEPVPRVWRGVPLDLVARLLDREARVATGLPPYDPLFLFALLKLRPLVAIWRGPDAEGSQRYYLWYKGLGEIVGDAYAGRLQPLHAQIAELAVETAGEWLVAVGDLERPVTAIPTDSFLWRYALPHAVLSGRSETFERTLSAGIDKTLSRVSVVLQRDAVRYAEAIAWCEAHILLNATGFAQIHPGSGTSAVWLNNLAGAHVNRGNALQGLNRFAEAVAAYDAAIAIMEGLRAVLEPDGALHPSLCNDLAGAHVSRGNALQDLNLLAEAVAAYDAAIAIMEGLRAALEADGAWHPSLRNDLAAAHMNRGVALQGLNRLGEAMAAYDAAIAIMEGLRAALEPEGAWHPSLRNDLAGAHVNRGNALQDLNRLGEAMAAYDAAIAIMEGLRAALEREGAWHPSLRNDLAAAHVNRGVALEGLNRLAEAVAAYDAAIDIAGGLLAGLAQSGVPAPRELLEVCVAALEGRVRTFEELREPDKAAADRRMLQQLATQLSGDVPLQPDAA